MYFLIDSPAQGAARRCGTISGPEWREGPSGEGIVVGGGDENWSTGSGWVSGFGILPAKDRDRKVGTRDRGHFALARAHRNLLGMFPDRPPRSSENNRRDRARRLHRCVSTGRCEKSRNPIGE